MLVNTRPNGRKRPYALNDTYHSIPYHLAEIKLLVPSETLRLLAKERVRGGGGGGGGGDGEGVEGTEGAG
jgi:hypothetical protein